MQFINIIVHSVGKTVFFRPRLVNCSFDANLQMVFFLATEDMNYRVFLQYEFTIIGLDEYLEVSFLC